MFRFMPDHFVFGSGFDPAPPPTSNHMGATVGLGAARGEAAEAVAHRSPRRLPAASTCGRCQLLARGRTRSGAVGRDQVRLDAVGQG